MLQPFMLEPSYRDYVWGGNRLRPNVEITAEAWIVYEGNKVANGVYAGKTLAEVTAKEGETLLGSKVFAQTGSRFPLLIKLLDCADWLSLQVHPNDEQAEQLEGSGHFGKTEAWYVVEADDGAQLLGGLIEGVSQADIKTGLQKGQILSLTQRHDVQTGDSIFIPAGMIHALGPGLLIYEVQQTSDITYRVYDWDRPMTAGRKLHIDQAAVVLNPELRGELLPGPPLDFEGAKKLIASSYFGLDLIVGKTSVIDLEPREGSFSAITILDGHVKISGPGWQFELTRFETLVIPAIWRAIQIEFKGRVRALRSAANAGQLMQPR
jgi:mannose-6-phosphate isomerase